MLIKVWHYPSEIGFIKVPCHNEHSIWVFVLKCTQHIMQFRKSHTSVCVRWGVKRRGNDRGELARQVERTALYPQVLHTRRAAAAERGNTPGIASLAVEHETHSSTLSFVRLCRSAHAEHRESIQRGYGLVQHGGGQPCFTEAQNVTIRLPRWKVTLVLRECIYSLQLLLIWSSIKAARVYI